MRQQHDGPRGALAHRLAEDADLLGGGEFGQHDQDPPLATTIHDVAQKGPQ